MIELAVECQKLLVVQLDDLLWVSTRLKGKGSIGKKRTDRTLADNRIVVGTIAEHLVVDNTLKVTGLPITDESHSFLPESLLPKQGSKDRIGVDMEEVVKILFQGTCSRIERLVRVGHRVHERVGAPLEQGHEGVAHRIALGPSQHTVFENVGDAAVVAGECAEDVAEEQLSVIIDQLEDFEVGFNMLEEIPGSLVLLQMGNFHQLESGNLITNSPNAFTHAWALLMTGH
ncbi:hypothetical protein SDC9_91220 [bioreactor metagenome]|uniref:Uncharacterized protein n=1 Tax=bioreactor metagenome TaxID=1076179 RepID=A0A644ZUK7_9ZZZZ